ncbi:hypothetical protein D3C72_1244370 [compost metagenome]
MARPEPKTKAPALAKNTPIWVSSGQSSVLSRPLAAGTCVATSALAPLWRSHLGGARQNQASTPAARNSQAISDSVTMVTVASTR